MARVTRPHHSRHSGFGLVEIMVALVIGMLAAIVMMQVFALSEERKRTTTNGADIQSNTINIDSGSGQHWRTFTFGTPATVTPGNTYYIVFRRTSLGGGFGGNNDAWNGAGTNVYSDGKARVSTDGGSSWSDAATVLDF